MASLATALQNESTEYLQQLATAWGITPIGTNNRTLAYAIMANMTNGWHIRNRLEEMGETERQILFLLANNHYHWSTLTELANRFRFSGQDATPAAESLSKIGMVLLEDWQEFQKGLPSFQRYLRHPQPPRGETVVVLPRELEGEINAVHRAMDEGDISHDTLRVRLILLNVRQLQQVAKLWDIPRPYEYSKQELIEELLRAMSDVHRVWAAATAYHPGASDLLEMVVKKGHKVPVAELRKEVEDEELRRAYEALVRAWLIQETYVQGHRFLFIPPEIRVALGATYDEGDLPLAPVQIVDERAESHLAFVEDLLTIVNFVSNNNIELTSSGHIPQRVLTKIGSLFHNGQETDPDNQRLSFVINCGIRLRLVRVLGAKFVPGDGIDEWVRLSTAEQVQKVLSTWISSPRFEAAHVVDYFGYRVSWPTVRSRLLKYLAANCKVNKWYEVKSFADFVVRTDLELLGSAAIRNELKRIGFLHRINTDDAVSSFVANIITFPLYWLGLVALATTAPSGSALCFTLTSLGAWALKAPGGEPPPEPNEKPLIVQPNFEIVSILAGGLVLQELARFADLTRSDKARVYSLTKESVLRGVDGGLTSEQIIDFLGQHAQKEVPQNVAYSIADWARQFRPVSFSTPVLVEVDAEHILSELLASKRFSSYFSRRLSPTTAILNPKADLKKLSNELRKRGYSPHIPEDAVRGGRYPYHKETRR